MIPAEAIDKALALLPAAMDSVRARVMLAAIGLQESGFTSRVQYGNGPARGFWQFEQGGGVIGVLSHHSTAEHARKLCTARHVPAFMREVHAALADDDVLAAGFARLLLWTDRHALPAEGDEAAAWECYLRTWRPGKPHRERWAGNYAAGLSAVFDTTKG